MIRSNTFRSYVIAGVIWFGLLFGGVGVMEIYRIGHSPDFQKTFGRPPDEAIAYVCVTDAFWQDETSHVPCVLRKWIMQEIQQIGFWLAFMFLTFIASPLFLYFGLIDGEVVVISLVLFLLSPWFFIPFIGYGISRFDRWKDVKKTN